MIINKIVLKEETLSTRFNKKKKEKRRNDINKCSMRGGLHAHNHDLESSWGRVFYNTLYLSIYACNI